MLENTHVGRLHGGQIVILIAVTLALGVAVEIGLLFGGAYLTDHGPDNWLKMRSIEFNTILDRVDRDHAYRSTCTGYDVLGAPNRALLASHFENPPLAAGDLEALLKLLGRCIWNAPGVDRTALGKSGLGRASYWPLTPDEWRRMTIPPSQLWEVARVACNWGLWLWPLMVIAFTVTTLWQWFGSRVRPIDDRS